MVEEHTECQNDHSKLVGDYCHTCGQRADEPRRAVIGLVQDVFIDTLAIDGKLARTIFLLLWRPGVLARRYLDGRRVHYSPPFRLYLFTSVFFFLSVFWVADFNHIDSPDAESARVDIDEEIMREIEMEDPVVAARLRALTGQEDGEDGASDASGKAAKDISKSDATKISFTDTSWEDANYSGPGRFEPVAKQMYEAAQRVVQDPRLFISEIRQNLPRTLLLAPVLYALILLLLYFYRRKFYIYDHFVISLYMHAALYAYLLLAIMLSFLPGLLALLSPIPLIWGAFQPLLVLRQAYGSRWVSAVLKSIIMVTIYSVGLALIITLGLTYSLYQS